MKRINLEDIIQVCLGSALLATPIAFTEESWRMSQSLPDYKIILILFTSLVLNASFIFYGIYEGNIKGKELKFSSRVLINYLITLLTVSYISFLLDILPSIGEFQSWIPRIILISFPASLSGAVLDSFDKE